MPEMVTAQGTPHGTNRSVGQRRSIGYWLFVWLGSVVAGGFFGLLAAYAGGMILGAIIACLVGIPAVLTFATLSWALWLPRFSIAIAALVGALTGVVSMAIIPLPLFFLSFPASYLLAACFGATGSAVSGLLYCRTFHALSESRETTAKVAWQFSLRDLFLRFTVVSVIIAGWTLAIVRFQTTVRSMQWPDQATVIHSGYEIISEAKQIEKLFGPAWHYMANYRGPNTVEWFTEALFGGRYELTMFVPAEVDRQSGKLARITGTPRLFLREVTAMQGRSVSYGRQYEFSAKDWKKVVAADGDFSAIGIPVDLNNPVPGFAELQNRPRNGIQLMAD